MKKAIRQSLFPRSIPLACLALGIAVVLAACVWTVPEPQATRGSLSDPVSLRIGVYFSPEFQNFSYQHNIADTAYVLGKPSVRLLKETLSLLFAEVVESPLPGSGSALRVDLAGVIEPRIVSAGHKYPTPASLSLAAHITYGFTVHSPTGKPVASWEVTGWGRKSTVNPLAGQFTVKRNFELAMEEAASNFAKGFRDIPEVRRWLKEQGAR